MTDEPVRLILTDPDRPGPRSASVATVRPRAEAIVHLLLGLCWPRYRFEIEPIPEADH